MSDCIHETKAERRRKLSNDVEVIVEQCLICGRRLRDVSKNGRILAKLDWFDPSIAERFDARRQEEYEQRQEQWRRDNQARTGPWWESYKEYLNSDHWRIVRGLVLERDPLCQKCFMAPATEAHHLTYNTFTKRGFTYIAECVGLCHECHQEETDASQAALPYRDA